MARKVLHEQVCGQQRGQTGHERASTGLLLWVGLCPPPAHLLGRSRGSGWWWGLLFHHPIWESLSVNCWLLPGFRKKGAGLMEAQEQSTKPPGAGTVLLRPVPSKHGSQCPPC